jgi:hypothetical protein
MYSNFAAFLVRFYWQKIKNVGAPTFSTARIRPSNMVDVLTPRANTSPNGSPLNSDFATALPLLRSCPAFRNLFATRRPIHVHALACSLFPIPLAKAGYCPNRILSHDPRWPAMPCHPECAIEFSPSYSPSDGVCSSGSPEGPETTPVPKVPSTVHRLQASPIQL